MDLERLNLNELRSISHIIKVLGLPVSEDGLLSCINVLEGALGAYRRELKQVTEANNRHA